MMTPVSHTDQDDFKRILFRNISLPLVVGVISAAIFVGMIFYLLSTMKWVEHTVQVIANINEASQYSVNLQSGMRGYLVTGEESVLATYDVDKSQMANRLRGLAEMVSDNPVQAERFKRIQSLQTEWEKYSLGIIDMKRNKQDYLAAIGGGRGRALFTMIRNEFDDAIAMERNLLLERNNASKQTVTMIIGIYLTISLILAGLLAMLGRRDLLGLSTSYGNALKKHADHALVLQQQAWLRSGQTELTEQVIGQLATSAVGDRVLEFLAKYLNVSVAAFYVREGSNVLQRVASYGFANDESLGRSFVVGEGLVGQAARENRLLSLHDVPDNYLKVASGLGNSKPKMLVLLPFSNEGKVNGVVELGFMDAVQERDLDLLKLLADNIGTSIGAALYRQQLQDVLAETQQLNEELQVQQEELRTANEELEEQSRVLEESQANLENQKAELEQINDQLTEQTSALDRKNAALNTAQVELEKNAQDLQRASKYKSEFLANMSHELRTPLNSSLILAKLLSDNKKGNLDEEQIKFAQTIYSAGNDLLNLINDILDISKVEAGKLELSPQQLLLRRMAEELSRTFQPLANQKKLAFTVEIEPTAPELIVSDPARVDQILKNLLSNAIKFTEAGTVTLRIAADQNHMISFAVSDSGIGIAAEQHETIFEAFQQADGTINRRYGGTGLGLSISRDLSKLLGGSIRVCSTIGKGSTFTLTLPEQWQPPVVTDNPTVQQSASAPISAPLPLVATQPSSSTTSASEPATVTVVTTVEFPDDRANLSTRNRTILVIEDELTFAGILYELAHEMQFNCMVAQSAQEGLELTRQFLPDAILLDIRLPDRSGLTVLQQLKEDSLTRHIPIHMVSGMERSDAAMHLGAIGYANKPVTREQLKNVFQKLEEKFTQEIKRILVVEDDARQRDSVIQLLGDLNVEITAVELGEQALQLLRTTVFDCMIIDLKLPDIQGHELLQRMTLENIPSFPPVIVYTGRNLTQAEEADLMKYSRSIILKGARSPGRLLDEVTLFLHKVESQLPSQAQTMLKEVRSRDRIFEGRKILLVDDDVRNIFALTSALEQKGVNVQIGRNGFEAISKLDEVPDIDLVLMDVMMPGMDGLEATRRIRQDARFQKLPIIAVTAKAMKDDQEQCMQAGATDYLAKPIDLDRLYALLRIWMPHLERHAD
ncbi:response regulator [Undibacterium pigrum]|uniref:Virulence sensor protein BvgS n=1 Tax=Undibacterium pigrum TaxID=401470 RepID=A0A318JB47_9BURK|nr:response regulator [Undibacterium pigrum]PXX45277.1 signal transduction histidine kinase [Undibacterium pigrum]